MTRSAVPWVSLCALPRGTASGEEREKLVVASRCPPKQNGRDTTTQGIEKILCVVVSLLQNVGAGGGDAQRRTDKGVTLAFGWTGTVGFFFRHASKFSPKVKKVFATGGAVSLKWERAAAGASWSRVLPAADSNLCATAPHRRTIAILCGGATQGMFALRGWFLGRRLEAPRSMTRLALPTFS